MAPIARLVRSQAGRQPFRPGSFDLILLSPPYWRLRTYPDPGQLGAEASPAEYLTAMWGITGELADMLTRYGNLFVNIGDTRAGSGGPGGDYRAGGSKATHARWDGSGKAPADAVRAKSLHGIPQAYALGCTGMLADLGGPDPGLRLILRQEIVWHKLATSPESAEDRCQASHEVVYHFAKDPLHYGDMTDLREPHKAKPQRRLSEPAADQIARPGQPPRTGRASHDEPGVEGHPWGAAPRSVWTLGPEPFTAPEHLDIDHHAVWPPTLARRITTGWAPTEVCLTCQCGRERRIVNLCQCKVRMAKTARCCDCKDRGRPVEYVRCRCWDSLGIGRIVDPPPTRPARVFDPFNGSGTSTMVAEALGRHGFGADLSEAYLPLARWRTEEGGAKVRSRAWEERQGVLL